MIVAGCPMCHSNLDMRQSAIRAAGRRTRSMPVLYVSELLGLAAGIAPKTIGLDRHFVDAMGVARKERLTMARIGVFICHCGENIARTVDVAAAAAAAGQDARRGVQRGLQVHVLRPGPATGPPGDRGPQADRRGGRRVQPADARDHLPPRRRRRRA